MEEKRWHRFWAEDQFRAERLVWSQKVKNPFLRRGRTYQFHSSNSPFSCLFFFFFWMRGVITEKGQHQVDFEGEKTSSINISEMERKRRPRTTCKSQTGYTTACIVLYAEVAFIKLPVLLTSGNTFSWNFAAHRSWLLHLLEICLSEKVHPWEEAAEQFQTYFLDRFLVDHPVSSCARVLQTIFSFIQWGCQNSRGQSAFWDLHGQSYKELLVDIFKAFSLKVKW